MKKKITSLLLMMLVAMVVALPASASTVQTIHLGYLVSSNFAADVGETASIHITNDGYDYGSYESISYSFYYGNNYWKSGTLAPGEEFSGVYDNMSPSLPDEFQVYISCSGWAVCYATATLEILN